MEPNEMETKLKSLIELEISTMDITVTPYQLINDYIKDYTSKSIFYKKKMRKVSVHLINIYFDAYMQGFDQLIRILSSNKDFGKISGSDLSITSRMNDDDEINIGDYFYTRLCEMCDSYFKYIPNGCLALELESYKINLEYEFYTIKYDIYYEYYQSPKLNISSLSISINLPFKRMNTIINNNY